ncbi:MAG TPA: ribonucleoside-diphosphate reductase subunit alpha [Thermomicrobiales bacterium]|jgi:ribonucleoside-diphosphate reductase alpha chain|nr:ribonucleoside-diphosphate reductase subunit alpha [Thermomicrobiales bacterium]
MVLERDHLRPSSRSGDGVPSAGRSAVISITKRDGRTVPFDGSRIAHAIEMAFRAENGIPFPDPIPSSVADRVERITNGVIGALDSDSAVTVESVQDLVERQLMADGAFDVARRYILYREARARRRYDEHMTLRNELGESLQVNRALLRTWISEAAGTSAIVDLKGIEDDVVATLHDGMTLLELDRSIVLAARSRIERHPAYAFVASKALLRTIYSEVVGRRVGVREVGFYASTFAANIRLGIQHGLYTPELAHFDLDRLGAALAPERDLLFRYLGLQTLYDRYLVHHRKRRIELPQTFWMRVAMGLALGERPEERNERAISFYEALSSFRLCSSSPTLFNAGTLHPQLSSCYLTTVSDDLDHIFKSVRDNALLSKWSGGLGNDWTNVRALGSHITGTNGQSQGVIPFLKVVNDAAVAVNQGGKRKGAVCAYLENWHLDVEEFLDLRKNTGDDRRRTHDMNTALWVPDLFMQRVAQNGTWTLFSPDDVPDLHDLYGAKFAKRYAEYEAKAAAGEIPLHRTLKAVDLWRRMLTALYETGHPWITFKDPSNVRSPQDHVGVVHNSNLCTEILLNTSEGEIAVCNLASVNLVRHIVDGQLDREALGTTVELAIRMLDNVIDINYYPVPEARDSNLRHRPIGLGLMGFQDALSEIGVSYASPAAVEFADRSTEMVAWHAYKASADLAAERGAYPSFAGSKWDRGLMPQDTLDLLAAERGENVEVVRGGYLDWAPVRAAIAEHGIRNSNCMAIAPTATISNIQGVSQSIEPLFSNLFVKSNLSGEFTVVNEYLHRDLDAAGLWDDDMLQELKYWDGSIQHIERIPLEIQERYPTAFEVDSSWTIECAARRQKWIDMGQSLNLYVAEPNGRMLNDMYTLAWRKGLKTTYYLRSRGATQAEKSTLDVNRFGIQPRWMKSYSASGNVSINREAAGTHSAPAAPAAQALTTNPVTQAIAPAPMTTPVDAPARPMAARATDTSPTIEPELDCEACQ